MDINDYQSRAGYTAIYPDHHTGRHNAVTYTILGLIGESGELANKWKKSFRDGDRATITEQLRYELGDVLWYVANLATELGMTLEEVAEHNLDKLNDRKERGQLKGSGDKR